MFQTTNQLMMLGEWMGMLSVSGEGYLLGRVSIDDGKITDMHVYIFTHYRCMIICVELLGNGDRMALWYQHAICTYV